MHAARVGHCQKHRRHPSGALTFANRATAPLPAPGIPFPVPRNDLLCSGVPASATSNYPRLLSATASPRPAAARGFLPPRQDGSGSGGRYTGVPQPPGVGTLKDPLVLPRALAALPQGTGDAWVSRIIINLLESRSRSQLK